MSPDATEENIMKRITATTAKLRGQLNYANVTATFALIFAMGGTAYAAATIGSAEIIDESIHSVDIKNGQVRSDDIFGYQIINPKIAPNAVDGSKLAAGAVTSDKVQDYSLTGQDILGSSLQGVRISGVEQTSGDSANESSSPKSAAATCPAGKRVTGTGYNIVGGKTGTSPNAQTDVVVTSAYVSGNQVYVTAYEEQPTTANWKVTAIAMCAAGEGTF